MSETRNGALAVWYHEKGPRGGDHPKAQDVTTIMGARAIQRALLRELVQSQDRRRGVLAVDRRQGSRLRRVLDGIGI